MSRQEGRPVPHYNPVIESYNGRSQMLEVMARFDESMTQLHMIRQMRYKNFDTQLTEYNLCHKLLEQSEALKNTMQAIAEQTGQTLQAFEEAYKD